MDEREVQAVEDMIGALAVSRHAANDVTFWTKQVEISASRPAMELLAQQLPSLSKGLVATLPGRLKQLPASPTMAEVIQGEYQFSKRDAARRGVFVAEVAALEDFYAALADGASLAPELFKNLADQQVAKSSQHALAKSLGQLFPSQRERVAVAEVRWAMVETAILIVLEGEAAVAASRDLFGEGPFGYQRLAEGFELSTQLEFRGEPVKMRFGT
jgi:hypothetical protein